MWSTYPLLTLLVSYSVANLIGTDVRLWHWQSSIVEGDFLYITGGEQYTGPSVSRRSGITYVVDLSKSWNNETLSPMEARGPPDGMQLSRQPLMFYDQVKGTVNRYGGWKYNESEGDAISQLWSFEAESASGIWTQGSDISPNGESQTGPFAAATAFSNSTYFSVGGTVGQTTRNYNTTVLSGLATNDFSSGDWGNTSHSTRGAPEYRAHARAAFVPTFGAKGFLVVIGGESPPTGASKYKAGIAMVDMSSITLFDVGSQDWYTQTATGDVPPPRSQFCAVGTPSAVGFDIFVYGGTVNETEDRARGDDSGYKNVHMLSLPAFRWFKSNSSTPIRRAAHTCSMIGTGKRQMVSIGGWFPSVSSSVGTQQDPWTSGIGVFDMTYFAWRAAYDASAAPYESPDVVQQYYISSFKEPIWANESLASIFKYTAKSPDTSPPSDTNTSSAKPIGAIVGGAVGGAVVVLVSLLGLGYLWKRRKRLGSESVHELTAQPDHNTKDIKETSPRWMNGSQGPYYEVSGAGRPAQELSAASATIPELPGYER